MTILTKFLEKNTVRAANGLPLVHSTQAYFLKRMLKDKEIKTTPCDVFKGEDLNYFFVGRPAYKKEIGLEVEYWELPACIILRYDAVVPKRIFPFDSGAFANRIYPGFIQMMDMENYDAFGIADAEKRIIGAFFTSDQNYFKMQPRNLSDFEKRFSIGVDDEEIRALYKLMVSKSAKYDDRRFSIEIQSDQSLMLREGVVEAIVHPEEYCASDQFMDYIENELKAVFLLFTSAIASR